MAQGKIVSGAVVFDDVEDSKPIETPYIDVTVRLHRNDMTVTMGAVVDITEIK